MKKFLAVLLVLLIAGFAFAGGNNQKSSGGAATTSSGAGASASVPQGATLIGMAMPETHVQRWIKDGQSLVMEAQKRSYGALVNWANGDQPTQNQQIEGFLTQGAKALIIGNINDGVGSAVASAKRSGAIVIAYDRIIQGTSDYDYFITFNNYKVGTLQGEIIAEALNLNAATTAAPKYITLFAGSPTDANANFFFQGAIDVLNPFIDKGVLKVVGPYPKSYTDSANFQRIATEGWQAPVAKARMEGLLIGDARDVVLDAVLAPNDTLARAIIEACKADAKYQGKLPVVSGQDAEFDSMMSIKNGEQTGTIFKDTAKLAEAAVLLADQLLKGQPINIPGTVDASASAITADIAETGKGKVKTLLLDPIKVTRANLQVPVDAGFYDAAQSAQLK